MKKVSFFGLFIWIVAISFMLSSCNSPASKIIGKWEHTNEKGKKSYLEFTKKEIKYDDYIFKYKIEGNKIVWVITGENVSVKISRGFEFIDNDTLVTIENGFGSWDGKTEYKRVKK